VWWCPWIHDIGKVYLNDDDDNNNDDDDEDDDKNQYLLFYNLKFI
jgi:hypothetical protein